MKSTDKKTSFKIDKKIYIVFFVLIIIAITNAIVSTFTIEKSKKMSYLDGNYKQLFINLTILK